MKSSGVVDLDKQSRNDTSRHRTKGVVSKKDLRRLALQDSDQKRPSLYPEPDDCRYMTVMR